MCKVLGVSSSGFYDWFERPPSQRERHNAKLLQAIKDSHEASDRTYGSPRVVLDLLDAGLACSENRVARLMKAAGIKARHKRRRAPGWYNARCVRLLAGCVPNNLTRVIRSYSYRYRFCKYNASKLLR